MKPGNDIRNELTALGSSLADWPRQMPYEAPAGYFRANPLHIRESLQYEEDPLADFGKQMPYGLPGDYFGSLPGQIIARVSETAADGIPASGTPFEVPAGYFSGLPGQVMQVIKNMPVLPQTIPLPAESGNEAETGSGIPKIIPLPRRIAARKTIGWAAAAMLVIAAGLGLYRFSGSAALNMEQQLAQVPRESIKAYVLQHIDEFDTEELAALDGAVALNIQFRGHDAPGREDIIQYLDETGWDTEVY